MIQQDRILPCVGFDPVIDPGHPYGPAVDATIPGARWLRHKQQTLDNTIVQALLRATVHVLQHDIPDLGRAIAIDVRLPPGFTLP